MAPTPLHLVVMMRLDCPMDNCTASIEAETKDAVMGKAADHAAEKHPELELDDQTVQELRSQIIQV